MPRFISEAAISVVSTRMSSRPISAAMARATSAVRVECRIGIAPVDYGHQRVDQFAHGFSRFSRSITASVISSETSSTPAGMPSVSPSGICSDWMTWNLSASVSSRVIYIWGVRLLAVQMVASLVFAASGAVSDVEAASKSSKLFGTKEIRNKNLRPFPKWTGMLKLYFKEGALGEGDCTSATFNTCRLAEWQKFLNFLEGKKVVSQVKAVNKYLNGVK
ncbi:MAG: hypothetical protein VCD31_05455 [Alphaproteobacteria bacterium]